MKKLVCIVLAALLCCMAMTAMAVNGKPGTQVTVTLSVTDNSNKAMMAGVGFSFDSSVLEFVSAEGVGAQAPYGPGANFVLNNTSAAGIPTGTFGKITFNIKEGAAPDDYPISLTVNYAYNSMMEDVTISVSGATVTVDDIYCQDNAHEWAPVADAEGDKAATCTEDGQQTYKCNICGKVGVTVLKATGHTEGTPEVTPATCTEDGKTVIHCATCNEEMSNTPIAKLGHDEGEWVETKAPTCTEAGSEDNICGRCGKPTDTREVEATGHTVVKTEAVEATCEKTGLTEGESCSVCKEVITAQEEIPVKDHDKDDVVKTAAGCTEPGKVEYFCSMCGKLQDVQEVDSVGHTEETVPGKAATCTETGMTDGIKCSVCGETVKEQEEIPALGHTEVKDEAVAPTCTKDGLTEGSHCSVCNEVIVKQEVVPAAHKPSEDAERVEPTCEKAGSISYVCTVCGETVSGEEIPALGHDWDEGTVTKAATCEAEGEKTLTCKNDATHTKTEAIAALGHAWDEGTVTKAPTCEDEGEKTFTCGNDATHTKTEAVAALGHAWNDGVVTVEPTCTAEGEKTFTCGNDATHTKTEAVAALGHAWGEWVVTKEPTADAEGEQERTCATCGEVETEVVDNRQTYVMTLCSNGIRFRDLENPITDYWYMFTPIDLSVEGTQEFELIAGNIHCVGSVIVTVADGNVTVTYKLFNRQTVNVFEEYVSILPTLTDMTALDVDSLTAYTFGEPISIEEDLGGDTKVLLFLRNRAYYVEGSEGVYYFDGNGKEYNAYVEELKQLMD